MHTLTFSLLLLLLCVIEDAWGANCTGAGEIPAGCALEHTLPCPLQHELWATAGCDRYPGCRVGYRGAQCTTPFAAKCGPINRLSRGIEDTVNGSRALTSPYPAIWCDKIVNGDQVWECAPGFVQTSQVQVTIANRPCEPLWPYPAERVTGSTVDDSVYPPIVISLQCTAQYFGRLCESSCAGACNNHSTACVGNLTANVAAQCQCRAGWTGPQCQFNCMSLCQTTACHHQAPPARRRAPVASDVICDNCQPGYTGQHCEISCLQACGSSTDRCKYVATTGQVLCTCSADLWRVGSAATSRCTQNCDAVCPPTSVSGSGGQQCHHSDNGLVSCYCGAHGRPLFIGGGGGGGYQCACDANYVGAECEHKLDVEGCNQGQQLIANAHNRSWLASLDRLRLTPPYSFARVTSWLSDSVQAGTDQRIEISTATNTSSPTCGSPVTATAVACPVQDEVVCRGAGYTRIRDMCWPWSDAGASERDQWLLTPVSEPVTVNTTYYITSKPYQTRLASTTSAPYLAGTGAVGDTWRIRSVTLTPFATSLWNVTERVFITSVSRNLQLGSNAAGIMNMNINLQGWEWWILQSLGSNLYRIHSVWHNRNLEVTNRTALTTQTCVAGSRMVGATCVVSAVATSTWFQTMVPTAVTIGPWWRFNMSMIGGSPTFYITSTRVDTNSTLATRYLNTGALYPSVSTVVQRWIVANITTSARIWSISNTSTIPILLVSCSNNLVLGSRVDGTTYITTNRISWEQWWLIPSGLNDGMYLLRSVSHGRLLNGLATPTTLTPPQLLGSAAVAYRGSVDEARLWALQSCASVPSCSAFTMRVSTLTSQYQLQLISAANLELSSAATANVDWAAIMPVRQALDPRITACEYGYHDCDAHITNGCETDLLNGNVSRPILQTPKSGAGCAAGTEVERHGICWPTEASHAWLDSEMPLAFVDGVDGETASGTEIFDLSATVYDDDHARNWALLRCLDISYCTGVRLTRSDSFVVDLYTGATGGSVRVDTAVPARWAGYAPTLTMTSNTVETIFTNVQLSDWTVNYGCGTCRAELWVDDTLCHCYETTIYRYTHLRNITGNGIETNITQTSPCANPLNGTDAAGICWSIPLTPVQRTWLNLAVPRAWTTVEGIPDRRTPLLTIGVNDTDKVRIEALRLCMASVPVCRMFRAQVTPIYRAEYFKTVVSRIQPGATGSNSWVATVPTLTCGACNRTCPLSALHAPAIACRAGNCEIAVCDDGWLDLNHQYADGCEVDVQHGQVGPCVGQDTCPGLVMDTLSNNADSLNLQNGQAIQCGLGRSTLACPLTGPPCNGSQVLKHGLCWPDTPDLDTYIPMATLQVKSDARPLYNETIWGDNVTARARAFQLCLDNMQCTSMRVTRVAWYVTALYNNTNGPVANGSALAWAGRRTNITMCPQVPLITYLPEWNNPPCLPGWYLAVYNGGANSNCAPTPLNCTDYVMGPCTCPLGFKFESGYPQEAVHCFYDPGPTDPKSCVRFAAATDASKIVQIFGVPCPSLYMHYSSLCLPPAPSTILIDQLPRLLTTKVAENGVLPISTTTDTIDTDISIVHIKAVMACLISAKCTWFRISIEPRYTIELFTAGDDSITVAAGASSPVTMNASWAGTIPRILCGTTDVVCPLVVPHGAVGCTAGRCVIACDFEWVDVNGDLNDGCERLAGTPVVATADLEATAPELRAPDYNFDTYMPLADLQVQAGSVPFYTEAGVWGNGTLVRGRALQLCLNSSFDCASMRVVGESRYRIYLYNDGTSGPLNSSSSNVLTWTGRRPITSTCRDIPLAPPPPSPPCPLGFETYATECAPPAFNCVYRHEVVESCECPVGYYWVEPMMPEDQSCFYDPPAAGLVPCLRIQATTNTSKEIWIYTTPCPAFHTDIDGLCVPPSSTTANGVWSQSSTLSTTRVVGANTLPIIITDISMSEFSLYDAHVNAAISCQTFIGCAWFRVAVEPQFTTELYDSNAVGAIIATTATPPVTTWASTIQRLLCGSDIACTITVPHGRAVCTAGRCPVTCDYGWTDLNTRLVDGCEYLVTAIAEIACPQAGYVSRRGLCWPIARTASPTLFDLWQTNSMPGLLCGAPNGNECPSAAPHTMGPMTCQLGQCVAGPCESGWFDLDGIMDTGCESHYAPTSAGPVNLWTDQSNCGAIGVDCGARADGLVTAQCVHGHCTPLRRAWSRDIVVPNRVTFTSDPASANHRDPVFGHYFAVNNSQGNWLRFVEHSFIDDLDYMYVAGRANDTVLGWYSSAISDHSISSTTNEWQKRARVYLHRCAGVNAMYIISWVNDTPVRRLLYSPIVLSIAHSYATGIEVKSTTALGLTLDDTLLQSLCNMPDYRFTASSGGVPWNGLLNDPATNSISAAVDNSQQAAARLMIVAEAAGTGTRTYLSYKAGAWTFVSKPSSITVVKTETDLLNNNATYVYLAYLDTTLGTYTDLDTYMGITAPTVLGAAVALRSWTHNIANSRFYTRMYIYPCDGATEITRRYSLVYFTLGKTANAMYTSGAAPSLTQAYALRAGVGITDSTRVYPAQASPTELCADPTFRFNVQVLPVSQYLVAGNPVMIMATLMKLRLYPQYDIYVRLSNLYPSISVWRITQVSNTEVTIKNAAYNTYLTYSVIADDLILNVAPERWTIEHASGHNYYIRNAIGYLSCPRVHSAYLRPMATPTDEQWWQIEPTNDY